MTNGNVPDLGAFRRQSGASRAGSGFQALVRHLDADGTYEPVRIVQTPQGPVAMPHRTDYVDAEQLVEMVREMMQQELRVFAVRMKMAIPEE